MNADRSLTAGAHGQVDELGAKTGTPARIEVLNSGGGKLLDAAIAGHDHHAAMTAIHDWFAAHVGSESGFAGVGHRVVHGGLAYTEPVLIDVTHQLTIRLGSLMAVGIAILATLHKFVG